MSDEYYTRMSLEEKIRFHRTQIVFHRERIKSLQESVSHTKNGGSICLYCERPWEPAEHNSWECSHCGGV